jgi:hypothetical protein
LTIRRARRGILYHMEKLEGLGKGHAASVALDNPAARFSFTPCRGELPSRVFRPITPFPRRPDP